MLQINLCEDAVAYCSSAKLITKISDFYNGVRLGFMTISKSEPCDTLLTPKLAESVKRPMKSGCPPAKKAKVSNSFSAPIQPPVAPLGGKRDVTSLINTIIKPGSNEKAFQCSFCMYQSNRVSNVTRHLEYKHLPSSVIFKCQTCGKDFKLKTDLKRHYIKNHALSEPAAQAMINY